VSVLTACVAAAASRRASASGRRRGVPCMAAKRKSSAGGMPANLVRKFDREKKQENQEKKAAFKMDKNRPPPAGASGTPTTGAWEGGRPDSENERAGEFKSPFTGQTYDRWAPLGLKQLSTDRQGGLGRARAYETPSQRQLRKALEEEEEDDTPEYKKYYPGTAPQELRPEAKREYRRFRHAEKAGGFRDVFNQLVVSTLVDLKIAKSESPVWYIEPMAGEGEYHVSRLQEVGRPIPELVRWPTVEDLYKVLSDQDLTYMPQEIRSWYEAVRDLNAKDFEVTGPEAKVVKQSQEIQWLPSTAFCAMKLLREQDPVTLYEEHDIAFSSLFNFVRNFSEELKPHLELAFDDGMIKLSRIFIDKLDHSKAHGKFTGQRGLIVIDSDFNRGGEVQRFSEIARKLHKHWRAATVMVTYPLKPATEVKFRNFIRAIREDNKGMDLISAELYVDNLRYREDDPDDHAWFGCGCLIMMPTHTTAERIRAAVGVFCQEMSKQPGAAEIRLKVEAL